MSYFDVNHITTLTNYKGFVKTYTSDGNMNIVKMVVNTAGLHAGAPASYTTTYQHDANFHKTQETDPNGNGTKWTYDTTGYGNVLTVTQFSPSGATVNSSEGTQSLTAVTSYGYDLLNRLGYVDNTLTTGNRNYSYVYDNASRVPARTGTNQR